MLVLDIEASVLPCITNEASSEQHARHSSSSFVLRWLPRFSKIMMSDKDLGFNPCPNVRHKLRRWIGDY
jgi:hypothetical protein